MALSPYRKYDKLYEVKAILKESVDFAVALLNLQFRAKEMVASITTSQKTLRQSNKTRKLTPENCKYPFNIIHILGLMLT